MNSNDKILLKYPTSTENSYNLAVIYTTTNQAKIPKLQIHIGLSIFSRGLDI